MPLICPAAYSLVQLFRHGFFSSGYWASMLSHVIGPHFFWWGDAKFKKEDDARFYRIAALENVCGAEVVQILKLKRGYVISSHNLLILLG
jgi:hypothetical protein